MNSVTTNFLQRRYGVSLGRRYVLAAAGVMVLGAFACYPIDNLVPSLRLGMPSRASASATIEGRAF
ncbi:MULTISPECIES: hypothetical protein [Aphanizomenonaceae]|jgi:hypothetical protein|uniref:Uncharacterized protein n=1 Tax=Dolichospermum heterosporum TAC447 TaxID=747523 RepID=A0ABY5LXU1_9CYAN|nr:MULTISPECIES: hypothetical protein [Aphanizomenonaceae]MDK2412684.1 hypothetical protein [Aphanizomenon sp. 202]MDK2461996.1 hypothetical protein [Aphanizomenon sp. PH219]UUO16085.1 hypothetical protein NG743_03255 [Dolichospermum heterosporum TAC447]